MISESQPSVNTTADALAQLAAAKAQLAELQSTPIAADAEASPDWSQSLGARHPLTTDTRTVPYNTDFY